MTGVNDTHQDNADSRPVEQPEQQEQPEQAEQQEQPEQQTAAQPQERFEEQSEEQTQAAVVYNCAQENQRAVALKHSQQAVASDQCLVMPTDTVYGIAANAFSAAAVKNLLETKGRNRTMPPPVLIAHAGVLDGLADQVTDEARALAEAFWPGGLTLICHAQPSLQWDLGETHGTVALRVPDDDVAVELLSRTGPLAVSSANRTGLPAATSVTQAKEMLGDKVAVYLDAGNRGSVRAVPGAGSSGHPVVTRTPQASTIIDCTGSTPVVVRDGAISLARLREVVPSVIAVGDVGASGQTPADSGQELTAESNATGETAHGVAEESTVAGSSPDNGAADDGSVQESTAAHVSAQSRTSGHSGPNGHSRTGATREDSVTTPTAVSASTDGSSSTPGTSGTSGTSGTTGTDGRLGDRGDDAAPGARPDGTVDGDRPKVDGALADSTEAGTSDIDSRAAPARATSQGSSRATSQVYSQATALVASSAGLVSGLADGGTQGVQPYGPTAPDQNRHRAVRTRKPGEVQPVDRATAAALVAQGRITGESAVNGADSDQGRHLGS